jgi:very-short-patch-repair endonuclease
MARYPSLQRGRARTLRENQTDVEVKLWSRLRDRQVGGAKFRRQHPIGPYIGDFCCVEQALIVELDGGQHADQSSADQQRTKLMKDLGYRVLRFWNNEVFSNLEGVLDRISESLASPHPSPLPQAGEGTKIMKRGNR